jgi:hypothetical protein
MGWNPTSDKGILSVITGEGTTTLKMFGGFVTRATAS